MVHLGDTASFLRVVRIYVEKDELLLRIRKKNLRDLSRSYSRLVGRLLRLRRIKRVAKIQP